MTDETREQIKRDAESFSIKTYGGPHDIVEAENIRIGGMEDFESGATAQHPISHAQGVKEGRRQAIEEAKRLILTLKIEGDRSLLYQPGWIILKELEKLKL